MAHIQSTGRSVQQILRARNELLPAALTAWKRNPLSFTNIRTDSVKIVKTKDWRGENVPALRRDGSNAPGLAHLAPWSHIKYARTGIHGNRGRPMFGSDEARTHARDLQFELMVDGAPLGEDVYDAANEDFFLYCAWLQDIEAKYAHFILENLHLFPMLKDRLEDLTTAVRELKVRAEMSPVVKMERSDEGDPVPDSESVMYQQKLFIPMRKGTEAGDYEIDNEHDLQVARENRLVRKSLPFFDSLGRRVPLDLQKLDRDRFPVCVEADVEAMTFRQYYGLKLRPRKVMLLAECGAYDDSDWSPYGDNQ